MPAIEGPAAGSPGWLQRVARAFRPDRVRLDDTAHLVSVQNQSFGAYSRVPFSRQILETILVGQAAGENGLYQLTPAQGFYAIVHRVWSNQTVNLRWNATPLSGITGETAPSILWQDDPWEGGIEGAARITGSVATASITGGQSVQLQTAAVVPPESGGIHGPGVPWCRVRPGETFIVSNDTANESIAATFSIEIVKQ